MCLGKHVRQKWRGEQAIEAPKGKEVPLYRKRGKTACSADDRLRMGEGENNPVGGEWGKTGYLQPQEKGRQETSGRESAAVPIEGEFRNCCPPFL